MYCFKCPSFLTKSKNDINYHSAEKHSATGPKDNHNCKDCSIDFSGFYSLRHHKQRYHTAETTSIREKVEMQNLADAGDDKGLEEEL